MPKKSITQFNCQGELINQNTGTKNENSEQIMRINVTIKEVKVIEIE